MKTQKDHLESQHNIRPVNSAKHVSETGLEVQPSLEHLPRSPTMGGASPADIPFSLHSILHLHRTIGNRAVGRLLQAKLHGNQPEDFYEKDADRVAEEVMHDPNALATGISGGPPITSTTTPRLQRQAQAPTARAETPAAGCIVEDDAADVRAGQMRKSEFLGQLRTAVCSAAEEALSGTLWSAMGCPYLDRWFDYYSHQPGQHVERALRKYAPETAGVSTAREFIPIVTQRVRQGLKQWTETGEVTGVPAEFAQGGMPGVTATGLIGGLVSGALSAVGSAVSGLVSGVGQALSGVGRALFKRREEGAREGAEPQVIQSQLGSGHALDGRVKSRMESAFGLSFSRVRIHTDSKATELSDRLQARAFTVGSDVAFGAGEYQPGTLIGDALIAHELAHVVQQEGGSGAGAPMPKGDTADSALEEAADVSAVGAVVSLWGSAKGTLAGIGKNAMPRLRSGLRLQRCGKQYVTNVGAKVNVLSSGAPPFDPDVTEAAADATLSGMGLLSKVTKLAPPSNDYDCHGFTFLGGQGWINDDQVDAILSDNGYAVTTTPAVGDIVIYRSGGSMRHSGIITAVSGTAVTKIESKWGRLGLYRHAPNDVPASYGTWEAYHTSRPGGHRLRQK